MIAKDLLFGMDILYIFFSNIVIVFTKFYFTDIHRVVIAVNNQIYEAV
jgi:hypothetical protein